MRKILAVLLLVCAFSLFAQIPAGTKSVAVLTGEIGDLLADDFDYEIEANAGYFLMDALEIDAILGLNGSTVEDSDMNFKLGLGALYHMPLTPMFGLYGGAAFVYNTEDVSVVIDDVLEVKENTIGVPVDVGVEVFLTQNNAVRIANRFTLNLTEGIDNTDKIMIGTVHYFK
jgi:hypothetical protein